MISSPDFSIKKWYLSIVNSGLNGQTANFTRLADQLRRRNLLDGFDHGPHELGFLPWLKVLKGKEKKGISVQIHIPSAAWIIFFVPFFPNFDNVEFFLEGHLIETISLPWSLAWKYPSFVLPRVLINQAFWVSLLTFFGIFPRLTVASFHQKNELTEIGYPAYRIFRLPNCPPSEGTAVVSRDQKNGKPVLGYLGHGTPVKGLEVLVEGILKSKVLALPWVLRVAIGKEGRERARPLLQQLKTALGDRVEILDRVDSFSFLQSLDILLLPYVVDFGTMVYPVTLVDAIHAGTIPVVSFFPTLCEPLLKTNGRFFFPANDPEAMGETISHWVLMEEEDRKKWNMSLQRKARMLWGRAWEKRLERVFS